MTYYMENRYLEFDHRHLCHGCGKQATEAVLHFSTLHDVPELDPYKDRDDLYLFSCIIRTVGDAVNGIREYEDRRYKFKKPVYYFQYRFFCSQKCATRYANRTVYNLNKNFYDNCKK